MRAKLIDVGRRKFNGEIGFNTMNGLLREIIKQAGLMSRDIEIYAENGSKDGIIYAGFHPIGKIELVDGTFVVMPVVEEDTLTIVADK